jgi:microcystin-dependent protein
MTRRFIITVALMLSASWFVFVPDAAKAQRFTGDIMTVGFGFCPAGWAKAEGQLFSISKQQQLFALYGGYNGGDGRKSFGLPSAQGREFIGTGH